MAAGAGKGGADREADRAAGLGQSSLMEAGHFPGQFDRLPVGGRGIACDGEGYRVQTAAQRS